jgi:hypothetical protein
MSTGFDVRLDDADADQSAASETADTDDGTGESAAGPTGGDDHDSTTGPDGPVDHDDAAETDGSVDFESTRLPAALRTETARAAAVRREEVDRALSRLSSQGTVTDEQRRAVQRLARSLTGALVPPVAAVRAAASEQ